MCRLPLGRYFGIRGFPVNLRGLALNFKAGHAQWDRYQVDTSDGNYAPSVSEIITWYWQSVLCSADAAAIVNFELTTNLLDIPVFAIRHERNTYHIFKLSISGDLPLTNRDQIDPALAGTYTFHQASQFSLFLRKQCNRRKLSGEQRLQIVNKFVMSGAEPRIGQLFN